MLPSRAGIMAGLSLFTKNFLIPTTNSLVGPDRIILAANRWLLNVKVIAFQTRLTISSWHFPILSFCAKKKIIYHRTVPCCSIDCNVTISNVLEEVRSKDTASPQTAPNSVSFSVLWHLLNWLWLLFITNSAIQFE